jgi:hypothetical protein
MNISKKIKKITGMFVLCGALIIPTTAAFAASTGFVYDYSHQLTSNRGYSSDGSNVIINTTTTYYSGSQSSSRNFTIDLFQEHWYADSYISSKPQAKYGSDTATWIGVGAGTYHFVFKKEQDGQVLKGTGTIHN